MELAQKGWCCVAILGGTGESQLQSPEGLLCVGDSVYARALVCLISLGQKGPFYFLS